MSADIPQNLSSRDYQMNGRSYGRGLEVAPPKVETSVSGPWVNGIIAIGLLAPDLTGAAAMIDQSRLDDHHPDSGHVYQIRAEDMPWLYGEGVGSEPNPDDEPSSTAQPPQHENRIYLPFAVNAGMPDGNVPTAEPPTAVPPTETPEPTEPPTITPDPTMTPNPTETPNPTVAPTRIAEGLAAQTILSEENAVDVTIGGNNWHANVDFDQIFGLPGTANRIAVGEPAGFSADVVAQPLAELPPDVINVDEKADPTISMGLVTVNPASELAETARRTGVAYDWEAEPPQWLVDGGELCDESPLDAHEGPLTNPEATIDMVAYIGDAGDRRHEVTVSTADGSCTATVMPPAPLGEHQAANIVSGVVELPSNSKGLRISGIRELYSDGYSPLEKRHPALEAVQEYKERTGRDIWVYLDTKGYDKPTQDAILWGYPDAFDAFREGYLDGLYVTSNFSSITPDISPADLTLAVARQHGWNAITFTGVNSYEAGSYPVTMRYQPPSVRSEEEMRALQLAYLKGAYGDFMNRWGASRFPGLEIVTYANPANLGEPGRIQNAFLAYLPYQQLFVNTPRTAFGENTRATNQWRQRNGLPPLENLLVEQRDALTRPFVPGNLVKSLKMIGGDYPTGNIRLSLPLANGTEMPADWQERVRGFGTSYEGYAELILPIMPDAGAIGMDLLEEVAALPNANMRIIAIPPRLSEYQGPIDIMTSAAFSTDRR